MEFDIFHLEGPNGRFLVRRFLLDTGNTIAVLPASEADYLGMPDLGPAEVDTDNGHVTWRWSEVLIAPESSDADPVKIRIWVAPDDPEKLHAMGDEALAVLGYTLQRPGHTTVSQRRSICAGCSNKGLVQIAGVGLPVAGCTACNCPIASKTLVSGDGGCPAGLW